MLLQLNISRILSSPCIIAVLLYMQVCVAWCHDQTAAKSFDYVIVGGGTSGLVIANRLTEDPEVTVAVIEAGSSVFDNPNVLNTTEFGLALNTAVDWQYRSVPQKYTNDSVQIYHAGKAIGGTSAINGMTYIRAEDAQIDALKEIGNPGWSWENLLQYYKKAERFEIPSESARARGAFYEPQFHGEAGPVNVSFNPIIPAVSEYDNVQPTWEKLGFPVNKDTSSGKIRGFSVWPMTMDAVTAYRSDAGRAYYWSVVSERPNLVALVNTTATRIVWADEAPGKDGTFQANGVEIVTAQGEQDVIMAEREVIISAGSLRSPVLLEQSGVGNPEILKKYGVQVRVNLPGVGENLQDQPNTDVIQQVPRNYTGYPSYATFATAADIFGDNVTNVEQYVRNSIPNYAAAIAASSENATTAEIQEKLLGLQADLIFNKQVPVAEILTATANDDIIFAHWCLLPFSRGSVHMTATLGAPAINPNFFMLEWDGIAQVATAKLARRAAQTTPLFTKGAFEKEPGFSLVPEDATDDQWLNYLKSGYGPNYHPVGTAAMMSRDLGGVVSPELLVYGTCNVRVIDASVLPYQMDGHLSSTLYAFAEKTAEIIKSSAPKKR